MISLSSNFSSLAEIKLHACTTLPEADGHTQSFHCWEQAEIDALQLAFAAQRPLLVRGEPGIGKTQLARAAATVLGARLHSITINARTEPDDLLFRFDAVRRLADAQAGKKELDEAAYWEPGPLWRAYNWAKAREYGSLRDETSDPAVHVILIDEIDKADSDLPNSLLELLGQRRQVIPALRVELGGAGSQPPLTVITSNEERELPAPFLRRCIVLNLEAPPAEAYPAWLTARGKTHFSGEAGSARLATKVLKAAADQLADDRRRAREHGLHLPGAAEYLDLLHALARLAPDDTRAQLRLLDRLSAYAFVKNAVVEGQEALSQRRPGLRVKSTGGSGGAA
jgi:MoxR-like ATPase